MLGLIKLKNSIYTKKYAVDADQLNANFEYLDNKYGNDTIKLFIESTGQIYNSLDSTQFSKAVLHYATTASFFNDISTLPNVFTLVAQMGLVIPAVIKEGMIIRFQANITNTGASSVRFGSGTAISILDQEGLPLTAGAIVAGDFVTLSYSDGSFRYYAVDIQASVDALQESLKYFIESLGWTYSFSTEGQLGKAIAQYCVSTSFDSSLSVLSTNEYILKPFGSKIAPVEYTEGMLLSFRPPFANTLVNPYIQLVGLQRVPLVSASGGIISIGELGVNTDCIVKYSSGKFYIISSQFDILRLGSSIITGVSNDTQLSADSSTVIPTQHAVKTYVDNRTNNNKAFTVVSGNIDVNGVPNVLQEVDSKLRVCAGDGINFPLFKTSGIGTAISNTALDTYTEKDNAFDGDVDTYYESYLQGQEILGVIDTYGEEEIVPAYIGQKTQTAPIKKVRYLPYSADGTPNSVFFQYLEGGDALISSGIDIGPAIIYDPLNPTVELGRWKEIGPTVQVVDPDTGTITDVVQREIFPVVFSAGNYVEFNLETFTPSGANFVFRMVPASFTGNSGLQVAELETYKEGDTIFDPLICSYADRSLEVETAYEDLILPETDGDYVVIREGSSQTYVIIPKDLLKIQQATPTAIVGTHWVRYNNGKVTTLLFNESSEWVEHNFVVLGEFTILSSAITNIITYAYLGNYYKDNITISSATEQKLIDHIIGFPNRTRIYLKNISADLGYTTDTTVELTNNSTVIALPLTTSTEQTHNHKVESYSAMYINISNKYLQTKLSFGNLSLLNESTLAYATIDPSKWVLVVNSERIF